MNTSSWAIRNPIPPVALFLALTLAGLVSFARLPVTEMPNVDFPVVTVAVGLPGAGPTEIATQVIEPIETEVADLAGLDHVQATATEGAATLSVSFAFGTDTQTALNDVKDAVTAARATMPRTITEPVVRRLDFTGRPILTYAVSDRTRSVEALSDFVDDTVAREISGARGVGKVERLGGAESEVLVELDPDRLLAFGLGVGEVSAQLAQSNLDQGGGSGDLAGTRFAIRTDGSASSVEALAETPIRLPGGRTVPLGRLGTVAMGAADTDAFALYDGQPVVAFGVYRATGASDLVAAEGARAALDTLRAQYPDTSFALVDDATVYTEANFHAAMDTLYEGALLAIVVVLLFLRDWRATVVAFVALPLSIIPTFIVMDLLGFSLNTVSLLGVTLVVGILVDDAIVEIENIVRHIRMGRSAYRAAMEAAEEIGLTVIAISLTIVAVFAPVSFMGGIAGQFFKQFGLTVAVAVLFSLLVARLITPLFAAYFLRGRADPEPETDGWLMRRYLATLRWTLRHKAITLILGLGIFAGSIYSATLLPTEFIPPSDTGRSTLAVELPPGTTPAEARVVAREASARVREVPEVTGVFVNAPDPTNLSLQVSYGDKSGRERGFRAIEADLEAALADLPDIRYALQNDNGQRDVTVNVLGDTQEAAAAAATALQGQMKGIAALRDVQTDAATRRPEIRITPLPERAAEAQVSTAALASAVRVATLGDSDANLPRFDAGDRQVPVRVRINEAARTDISRLASFRVRAGDGTLVPLQSVADVTFSSGAAQIERYDRRYQVAIEADLAPGASLGPATEAIFALPATGDMPAGTEIQRSGDAETMNDIFSAFGIAMGAGIVMVYMVLTLLFGSFVTPLTIMLSLPLAIGGAIFALYVTGYGIGLSVVIGFLMLMGIVTKNAIMLVEFALEAHGRGVAREAAMIDAAHKRARPIVMTTLAMTAGMVPSALAFSTGGEFRAPMAVAVIGGLLLSTLLSLLFVPSLFVVMEGLKDVLRRGLTRVFGRPEPDPAE